MLSIIVFEVEARPRRKMNQRIHGFSLFYYSYVTYLQYHEQQHPSTQLPSTTIVATSRYS